MNKKLKSLFALALSAVTVSGCFVGCKKDDDTANQPYQITKRARTGWEDEKVYTMNDYTSQMPNTWCEFTSSDATNRDMASYFNSSFFEYNYQYDANGNIVSGGFTVDYSAATKLEDVTDRYEGKYGLTAEDVEEGHHAFAITLRKDLTWDDGTAIKAEDFVYTMQQQLSPDYFFTTASNYYSGNYILHNAQEYLYQGQDGWFASDLAYKEYKTENDSALVFTLGNATENKTWDGAMAPVREYLGAPSSMTAADLAAYIASKTSVEKEAILALQGKTFAEIKADAKMKATWDAIIGWWQTEPNEELHFFVAKYTYPEMDFSEVGYFVGENEYELVIVIDNTLSPLTDDGALTYEAAYFLESFPLVKKDLWEKSANKTTDGTSWTNSYCTDVASSASWGPYKLESYQRDKAYTIVRNDKWYGYGMDQYKGQYQTDKIEVEKVSEWATAWQLFQKGEIDMISMDATIANEYRSSMQAYFTPDTYTFDLNIQSKADARTAERNNLLLNYTEFRQAMSLAFNRDDYCAVNSPSSQAALGLLNDMYYYDVANKGRYRDTEQAKTAILEAYGATKTEDGNWKIGSKTYTSIDTAVKAVTGYDVAFAREKMKAAYEKAKAAGDYKDGEKIILTYGIAEQNATTERIKNWFQSALNAATEGTPFAGMVEIKYFEYNTATWSEQFEDGEYDLCFGAWGNAPFNPCYLLGETQLSDDYRYAKNWDPDTIDLTIKLSDGEEHTFNLTQWNSNMQGKSDAKLDLTKEPYTVEDQLTVLGKIEAAVLQAYYTIPVYSRYSASLMSYKCDYTSYDYNTFMRYGGIRYMTYHFDDTEWDAFVKEKGTLNYKFSLDE